MAKQELDFIATNHGSIVTLAPQSEEAREWCEDHLPEDAMMFGDAYAIEPRYFGDIVAGFQDDGLTSNVELEVR